MQPLSSLIYTASLQETLLKRERDYLLHAAHQSRSGKSAPAASIQNACKAILGFLYIYYRLQYLLVSEEEQLLNHEGERKKF